jgi:hypothetical protein
LCDELLTATQSVLEGFTPYLQLRELAGGNHSSIYLESRPGIEKAELTPSQGISLEQAGAAVEGQPHQSVIQRFLISPESVG